MAIKLPSHLHRSRSGILHFRIAIPPDLRHHFASREIYRSLQTANVRDAVHPAQALSMAFKRVFKKIRQQHMPNYQNVLTTSLNCPADDLDFVGDISAERDELGAQLLSILGATVQVEGEKGAMVQQLTRMLAYLEKLTELDRPGVDEDTLEAIRLGYRQLDALLDGMLPQVMAIKDCGAEVEAGATQLLHDVQTMALSRKHDEIVAAQVESHQVEKNHLASFVANIASRAPASSRAVSR